MLEAVVACDVRGREDTPVGCRHTQAIGRLRQAVCERPRNRLRKACRRSELERGPLWHEHSREGSAERLGRRLRQRFQRRGERKRLAERLRNPEEAALHTGLA